MSRHCMRPGCDRPAAARLTYDPVGRAVWLDSAEEMAGLTQQVCDVHATGLTTPRGWTVTDRRVRPVVAQRDPEPPVVDPPVAAAPPVDVEPPAAMEVPVAVDPPAIAEPTESTGSPSSVETKVAPDATEPEQPDQTDRPERAKRRSGLLQRAFDQTGPQHSILTSAGESPAAEEDPR